MQTKQTPVKVPQHMADVLLLPFGGRAFVKRLGDKTSSTVSSKWVLYPACMGAGLPLDSGSAQVFMR